MRKNELYRNNNSIIRVLEIKNNAVLVIDCINKTMPQCKRNNWSSHTDSLYRCIQFLMLWICFNLRRRYV